LSNDVLLEFPIWRIWLNGKDSLQEIRDKWNYNDVMIANALLDMQSDQKDAIDGYYDKKTKKGK